MDLSVSPTLQDRYTEAEINEMLEDVIRKAGPIVLDRPDLVRCLDCDPGHGRDHIHAILSVGRTVWGDPLAEDELALVLCTPEESNTLMPPLPVVDGQNRIY